MRYAVCNELFGSMSIARTCDLLAASGYDGIEVAPFTIAPESGVPTQRQTQELRRAIDSAGISFVGLHWLLARPDGLQITGGDDVTRRRSWDHLRRLIGLAGELGGGNLILGSPYQRSFEGVDRSVAIDRLVEGFSGLSEAAADANTRVLLEALPAEVTNLVNTIDEARSVVASVDHPAIGTMFDFHNVGDERESWVELIGRHGTAFGHVHINTPEGGHPTVDRVDEYRPAFEALATAGYDGIVSLEIFHQPEDPVSVIKETRAFLEMIADV